MSTDWRQRLRRIARLPRATVSTPRRRLLLATAAGITAGGLAWLRPRRAAPGAREILTLVADRLLPASGRNPGALALGLDESVLFAGDESNWYVERLVAALAERGFTDLDDDGRDRELARILADDANPELARTLRYLLDRLVREYYSRPQSFAALDYRQPQPYGYPEYADCPGDEKT